VLGHGGLDGDKLGLGPGRMEPCKLGQELGCLGPGRVEPDTFIRARGIVVRKRHVGIRKRHIDIRMRHVRPTSNTKLSACIHAKQVQPAQL
jgi:hypothetical protein